MLKITTDTDPRRLVVEGALSGLDVDTLARSWRDVLSRYPAPQVTLDLTDVTFADSRALDLLATIHAAGGVLFASGGMNAAMIREIGPAKQRAAFSRKSSLRALSWVAAAGIPLTLVLAACSGVRADQPALPENPVAPGGRPVVAVDVEPVTAGSFVDQIDVVGSLAPKRSADIKSEVSGIVAAVYVTEWVPVRAGARLARLNTAEGEAAIDAAKAVEAQARVAETRARREYERAVQLKRYGLITEQAVDDARSALEASEAATTSARTQVRAAEVRLSKSLITAPLDGVVAFRGVSVGDRVENIGSGDPMFRIVDNRVLDLTVSVPSTRLGAVRVGQPLEFAVDALPGRTFTGEVRFINPAVDEVGRSGRVIAEVRNLDSTLKGGLFVTGRILVSSRTDVPQVPRAALLNWNIADASAEVFVVRDGLVEKRPVRTGPAEGLAVAIDAGLAPGEIVVTRGGYTLKPGDRVTVAGEGR